MSLFISEGILSSLNIQMLKLDTINMNEIREQFNGNYICLGLNAERSEIMLRILDPIKFDLLDVRKILRRLQQLTQCSFVALVNIAQLVVSISIRG